MRVMRYAATAVLALTIGALSPATAQDQASDELARLRAQSESQARTIERLEAENARLAAELRQMKAELAAMRNEPPAADAPNATPAHEASPDPAPPAPAAELDRLREQNHRLQAENQALKQSVVVTDKGEVVRTHRVAFGTSRDESTGLTTLSSNPIALVMLAGSRATHVMTLRYTYPGADPTRGDAAVEMTIAATFSGGQYWGRKSFTFVIDGEEVACPVTDYKQRKRSGQSRVATGKDDETVVVAIPVGLLPRLGAAGKLTGALGKSQMRFSGDEIAMFAALAQKRSP